MPPMPSPQLGIFQPIAAGLPLPFFLLGERGSALFDCDNDGDLDSAMLASDLGSGDFVVNRNVNLGAGLVDIDTVPGTFLTGIQGDDSPEVSGALDFADFNGDGIPDVVVVASELDVPAENALSICYGDGAADACGFDCTKQVDFTDLPLADPQLPLSVEAGDFDGDGTPDNAVVLFASERLVYLFNNGNTQIPSDPGFTGNFSAGDSLLENTQPIANAVPAEVISGFFNTDDVLDVAVSNFANPTPGETSNVAVFLSDGAGGISPVELLSFPPTPPGATFNHSRADALEVGDFDHCGGDDLVVLALSPLPDGGGGFEPFKQAHFWQNINEPPVVVIDPNVPTQITLDTLVNIPTTCTDSTLDDRTFQWTTVSQPVGATVSFGTPTGNLIGAQEDAGTTFAADLPGSYTVQIVCTDACGLSDDNLDQIQISFNVLFPLTQGANLFNCYLVPTAVISGGAPVWGFMVLIAMPLLTGVFRRIRRCSSP
jgi:hypothetical protein